MPKMTAALHDGNGRMRIANVQGPEAGPGDAVIRVREAGICDGPLPEG